MSRGYAVITGASSGLGAEFAKQLWREGYSLILVARRKERLDELAAELCGVDAPSGNRALEQVVLRTDSVNECQEVLNFSLDLSTIEGCDSLMSIIEEYPVELFVNNAGFGDCGYFIETDVEKELFMIDVNVRTVHYLTKKVLLQMERQGYGKILNVASSAGLIPAGPYMATYYATKSYVASLSRAIAQELKEKGSPLQISVLCPGPVDTEFNSVANVRFALPGITAESCVAEALSGLRKGKVVIIPSLRMKFAIIAGRHLPQSLYIRLTGRQQKKKL